MSLDFGKLGNQSHDIVLDILAREEMGLLSEPTPEEFFDTFCEVASEHIDPPEDRGLDSFSLLVGASISAYVSSKVLERIERRALGEDD